MALITGGANVGQEANDSYTQGMGTISQDDLNKWLAMGGSNIFSQIGGSWFGNPANIKNIQQAISGAVTTPYATAPSTTAPGGVGGSGAAAPAATQANNPTTSATTPTAPVKPTPTITAPQVSATPSTMDMRTYNAMQNIYGRQNKLPSYTGSF